MGAFNRWLMRKGEENLPKLAHKTGKDTPMDIFRWQHWDRYFPDVPKPSLRAYLREPAKYGRDQDEYIRAATGDNVLFTQPKEGQMGLYGKRNQHSKEIMQGPEVPPMFEDAGEGFKAPELSRGAKYEYEPQQFDLWQDVQRVLKKKE